MSLRQTRQRSHYQISCCLCFLCVSFFFVCALVCVIRVFFLYAFCCAFCFLLCVPCFLFVFFLLCVSFLFSSCECSVVVSTMCVSRFFFCDVCFVFFCFCDVCCVCLNFPASLICLLFFVIDTNFVVVNDRLHLGTRSTYVSTTDARTTLDRTTP